MTRYELPGTFFATRHRARLIRDELEAMATDRAVTLNFAGVEAITGAFADELVCGLTAAGWLVTVEGANPEVDAVIQWAVGRRDPRMSCRYPECECDRDWPCAEAGVE